MNITDMIKQVNAAPAVAIPEEFADRDRFMAKAYEQASAFLIGKPNAEIAPTWATLAGNGQVAIVVTPFGDEKTKDFVAQTMRQCMRGVKATSYTFMSEAWMAAVTKEQWET